MLNVEFVAYAFFTFLLFYPFTFKRLPTGQTKRQ